MGIATLRAAAQIGQASQIDRHTQSEDVGTCLAGWRIWQKGVAQMAENCH
jgi:hypothetical protein